MLFPATDSEHTAVVVFVKAAFTYDSGLIILYNESCLSFPSHLGSF